MEELYEDLQAEGMDASGAEIMTVVNMGEHCGYWVLRGVCGAVCIHAGGLLRDPRWENGFPV